ncbi:hypothetical protein SYV04_17680 [Hyalangium sp. s54d21]|uniref:Uncharacterized protein n=1 Tax=Hyalangium rubrum TaxID=3103134 RepID=A0ABU5H4T7_9BACT|nr:hypothetical protein [Hyalangium sp. s54d21]MDY7228256.1 hypothetical protein [Hyalangium sp. s54d21]
MGEVLLCAKNKLTEGGIIAYSPTQYDRVSEITQELSHAWMLPPSQGCPHVDVILVGVSVEHGLQAREQHREKRDTFLLRQFSCGLSKRRRHAPLHRSSRKALHGGARPIHREVQGRGHPLELFPPPCELTCDLLPAQVLALPERMIPILELGYGKVRRAPFTACRVQRKQFGEEQAEGPVSIRDEMMHRHHEQMPLWLQLYQTDPPKRTMLQVKRAGDLLARDGQGLFLCRSRVCLAPGKVNRVSDSLSGLPIHFDKGCPEDLVSLRHLSECLFQHKEVEWTLEPGSASLVESRCGAMEFGQEPHAFLLE